MSKEIKISKEEIEAAIKAWDNSALENKKNGWMGDALRAALTVRKRLKAERKEAKRKTFKIGEQEAAKEFIGLVNKFGKPVNSSWDGRLNVWIPWEAKPDSVCPVPDGAYSMIRLGHGRQMGQYENDGDWDWSKREEGDTITAYMVTKAPPQAEKEWDGKFDAGRWLTRDGTMAIIHMADENYLFGKINDDFQHWRRKTGEHFYPRPLKALDLIRPWQDKEG